MAYNALNNLIDAYIYANGVQAITGQILNGVLKQMVSQLGSGYHLMGVADPETVPASNDYAMAYFAATAGEYTDFGGITLAAGEVAVLLTSGNGSWSKQTIYNVPTTTEDLENTAGFITNAVTDLVNYYTKTEVDDTLADYPTLEALATALADYYTKQEIDTTLEGYPTKQDQETALGDYYTKDEMDAALGDRYTKDETDTKLADYYKKTETYDKDEVDSIVAALSRQEYIVAWDGLAAPDVSAIPAGVTVTYSGTTYTGTLAASASTVNKIYMVWNGTAYDMYGTSQDGGYSWVPMGTTTVDLSQYATKAEVSQLEAKVDGLVPNYEVGKYLESSGNTVNSDAWCISDYVPVANGDTVVWNCGVVWGTPALCTYDSEKNLVGAGYVAIANPRTITISGRPDVAYMRASFVLSTIADAKLIVNGETAWTPTIQRVGLTKRVEKIESSYIRTSLIIPSGGTMFIYNRDTKVMTLPSSTAIRLNNGAVVTLGTQKTITLSHYYGYIVYDSNTGEIADRYDQALGENEYLLFAYNYAIGQYANNELSTTLPQNSLSFEGQKNNIKDFQKELDYRSLVRGAKYAFSDNLATPLQLIWFSDLHADEQELWHIKVFREWFAANLFDDVIATGDQQQSYFSGSFDYWASNGANNYLQVIGNHEVWEGGTDYVTAADAYQKFFAPYISNWNVVSPGANLCYYYKDYSSSNIRLIVLDCMNWDSTQESWLVSTLNSAKSAGLYVVIAAHYIAGNPTLIDCNYTAINMPTPEDVLDASVPAAVANFMSDGGHFVCYIGGHYHKDCIYKLANYPNQYGILTGCASRNQTEKNNFRGGNTSFADLFNILQIDITYKMVKIVRVGADTDRWMRHKKLVSLNYETGEVVVF